MSGLRERLAEMVCDNDAPWLPAGAKTIGDAMQAVALAAARLALDEAARECDAVHEGTIADMIRALAATLDGAP